jgi:D-alanyl-D-alanine dipeptidase
MTTWKEIITKDCEEPLVDLTKFCPELVIDLQKKRMDNEDTAFLRESVVKMICQAKSYLPEGITFIIGDAWRPKHVKSPFF